MKKIVALLLCVLMVLPIFAGCTKAPAENPVDVTAPAEDVAMQYISPPTPWPFWKTTATSSSTSVRPPITRPPTSPVLRVTTWTPPRKAISPPALPP